MTHRVIPNPHDYPGTVYHEDGSSSYTFAEPTGGAVMGTWKKACPRIGLRTHHVAGHIECQICHGTNFVPAKSWEKPCPTPTCTAGMIGIPPDHRDPRCRGTGAVPMNTSEMIEALCETGQQDWITVGISFSDGTHWVGTENSEDGDCTSHDGATFDDALRFALEKNE
jgi:hypothetical protein